MPYFCGVMTHGIPLTYASLKVQNATLCPDLLIKGACRCSASLAALFPTGNQTSLKGLSKTQSRKYGPVCMLRGRLRSNAPGFVVKTGQALKDTSDDYQESIDFLHGVEATLRNLEVVARLSLPGAAVHSIAP